MQFNWFSFCSYSFFLFWTGIFWFPLLLFCCHYFPSLCFLNFLLGCWFIVFFYSLSIIFKNQNVDIMAWYACLCGVRLLTLKQQVKIKELLRWEGNKIQLLLQILNFSHDWQKNTFDYCTALKFNIFTVYF